MSQVAVVERASQRAFFGVSALLFAASAAVTIVWCASMSAMGEMPMPGGWTLSMAWMRMPGQTWPGAAASFLGMWVVMMVAMMLPSLVPMLWRYRQAVGRTGETRLGRLTALVGMGYFVVWTGFGMAAFPLGVALATIELQQPALARAIPIAVGVVVLIAGALQFTAWKARHLSSCREAPGCGRTLPADAATAWRHGLRLGFHCTHCCAGLMAILLGLGVMDLRAMAVVAAAITVERLAPAGERVARAIGAVAVAAGLFLIARAVTKTEWTRIGKADITMHTPPIVSPQEWEAARQQLLVKEKELTHARDALAASRRRMPWLAVEQEYEFDGPEGKASLLDLFHGRRQLIVYRAFFEPGVYGWPEHACRGCSLVADQVAHVAHLNARDTTLVFVSRAPQADIQRVKARMGWEMPWYTITDGFDADFGVDEWHGTNAFIRDGESVFRTYFINNRGDEAMGSTWSYLDLTALGRQEEWEDSPEGYPQTPPYEWWNWHDEYGDAPSSREWKTRVAAARELLSTQSKGGDAT